MEGERRMMVLMTAIDGSNITKTEGNRIRIIIRDNHLGTITAIKIMTEIVIIKGHNNGNLIRTTTAMHVKKIETIATRTLTMKIVIMRDKINTIRKITDHDDSCKIEIFVKIIIKSRKIDKGNGK